MEDIHDIKPPIELPILTQSLVNLFWVFLGIALLIVFLIIIYYVMRKYRRKKVKLSKSEVEIKENIVDYQKEILQKFSDLEKYLKNEEIKQFHVEASKLLRKYLSFKYQDNFTDLTAKEILVNKKISEEKQKRIDDFFKVSDLVKFARLEESSEEAKKIYSLLGLIINF